MATFLPMRARHLAQAWGWDLDRAMRFCQQTKALIKEFDAEQADADEALLDSNANYLLHQAQAYERGDIDWRAYRTNVRRWEDFT